MNELSRKESLTMEDFAKIIEVRDSHRVQLRVSGHPL